MSELFNAIVVDETGQGPARGVPRQLTLSDLPAEEVLVQIAYSSLNYKDGLAVTGRGKICRKMPMVCGIDLAGTVVESSNPDWQPGDRVLVNGYGLSELYWGGFSQKQRLRGEWLVRIPDGFTEEQAMAIGTAGYTAMLCVQALQDNGITPGHGDILVTGAAGGVGSVAVMLLAALGYGVVAATGRRETGAYLGSLGAREIMDRAELDRDCRPLEKETWAGVVDPVGAKTLATALAQTRYGGAVAACGLAGGADLPTSVMPFIIRGVRLCGVDSVMAAHDQRVRAWSDLEQLMDADSLQRIYRVEPMQSIPELAEQIIAGKVRGRIVVDVNR